MSFQPVDQLSFLALSKRVRLGLVLHRELPLDRVKLGLKAQADRVILLAEVVLELLLTLVARHLSEASHGKIGRWQLFPVRKLGPLIKHSRLEWPREKLLERHLNSACKSC